MPMSFKCPHCGYEVPEPPYKYDGYLKPHLPEILRLLGEGKTRGEIADALGLRQSDVVMIGYIGQRYGIVAPSPVGETAARNEAMAAEHASGASYAAIAKKHGISRTRAAQIVSVVNKRHAARRARQTVPAIADLPIAALDVPVRIRNTLAYCGCKTVGDALKLDPAKLRSLPNFGRVSMLIWQRCLDDLQTRHGSGALTGPAGRDGSGTGPARRG